VAKKIRGRVIREVYDNGKLVERSVNNNAVLNADHWRNWQNFDRGFGKTYLKTAFNYSLGENLLSYYSTTNDSLNKKIVYRRDFRVRPR